MPWLTHSNSPSLVAWTVYLPDDEDWIADFFGAFLELADPNNWEQEGTNTPDEEAAVWEAAVAATEP